jgi:ribosome-binding factor A
LRFHWDPTFERADHIEKLISSLHQSEGAAGGDEVEGDV